MLDSATCTQRNVIRVRQQVRPASENIVRVIVASVNAVCDRRRDLRTRSAISEIILSDGMKCTHVVIFKLSRYRLERAAARALGALGKISSCGSRPTRWYVGGVAKSVA